MQFFNRHKRTILVLLIILLAARVFIPQLDALADSLEVISQAEMSWLLIGAILYFTGVPVLAGQFVALSVKNITYALTLRVEAATLFVNKILPQGVGTISLNIYYFIKMKHTPSQASAAVTVNAIASTVAYIILIILALIFSDISIDFAGAIDNKDGNGALLTIISLLLIGLAVTLIRAKKLRQRVVMAWATFKNNITTYKSRPRSLLMNTVLNGIGTSLNVLTLMVCAKSIGLDISFADALLAYTFGNFAATLVPTPGGIGSAEMGIYSGLVLVGIDPAMAISTTLLYRLISYWLPIIPGYYFFQSLRKSIFSDYSLSKKTIRA